MSGNNQGSTPEFDEFVASGEVEAGDTNLASQEEEQPKKAAPRRGPPKPAAKAEAAAPAGDDDDQQGADDADGQQGGAEAVPRGYVSVLHRWRSPKSLILNSARARRAMPERGRNRWPERNVTRF